MKNITRRAIKSGENLNNSVGTWIFGQNDCKLNLGDLEVRLFKNGEVELDDGDDDGQGIKERLLLNDTEFIDDGDGGGIVRKNDGGLEGMILKCLQSLSSFFFC